MKRALLVGCLFCLWLQASAVIPKVYRHAFKFNAVATIAGDATLHYEQYLGWRFSVEGGVGTTWNNKVQQYFDLFSHDFVEPPDKFGLGWSFRAQVRYHPLKEEVGIKGSYVAIEYGQESRVFKFDYSQGTSASAGFVSTTNHTFHTGFLIGVEDNFEKRKHLLYDFHIGFGLRQMSWFDAIKDFIAAPDFKKILVTPVLLLGVKVGWGW